MAINFPDSPSTNDTFTANDNTFTYDGEKWILAPATDIFIKNPLEQSLEADVDGVLNIGSSSTRFDVVYANVFNGSLQADADGVLDIGSSSTRFDVVYANVFNGSLQAETNGVSNIGSSGTRFDVVYANVFNGVATEAKYADLAEIYSADANYDPGTVVEFGGKKEITQTLDRASTRVVGVISENPAYLMNSQAEGLPVALNGRVFCKVEGVVSKGDFLVSGTKPGVAEASQNYIGGAVIGKSLVDKSSTDVELIEILVSSS